MASDQTDGFAPSCTNSSAESSAAQGLHPSCSCLSTKRVSGSGLVWGSTSRLWFYYLLFDFCKRMEAEHSERNHGVLGSLSRAWFVSFPFLCIAAGLCIPTNLGRKLVFIPFTLQHECHQPQLIAVTTARKPSTLLCSQIHSTPYYACKTHRSRSAQFILEQELLYALLC